MMTLDSVKRGLLSAATAFLIAAQTPAADVTVTVRWDKVRGEISPDLFSMNLFKHASVSTVADPTYRKNVRYLRPAILRLHNAGTTSTKGGASLLDAASKDWNYYTGPWTS